MNLIQSNIKTMTLKEITDLLEVRHDKAMIKVDAMAKESSFGAVSKMDIVYNKQGQTIKTYILDERQSIAVASRLNTDLLMRVIDRWKLLEEKEQAKALAAQSRQTARLEAPFLTDAVKLAHDEPKHYHYSNEFNLINRIVLGMTSKRYRDEHDIGKADAIRDHLTPCEIAAIEHLQRANTTMIEIGLDYEDRKNKLNKLFVQRHQRKLLTEFKRLEY